MFPNCDSFEHRATLPQGPATERVIVSENLELNGFYSRQAFRCRLLAQHATGTEAAAINDLADRFERTAAELKLDKVAGAGW